MRATFSRPRLIATGALLSVFVTAAAEARTISNPNGNLTVPANTSGDPNLVVTASGTVTFAGRADADFLFVSGGNGVVAINGPLSAQQAAILTTGDNVTLSNALNSIDRATIDTSNGTGTYGDVVFNQQQGVVLDALRARNAHVAVSSGSISVTTQIHTTAALNLQATAGSVVIAGDTSVGANGSLSASSGIVISGDLTVPSLRTGYALQMNALDAAVSVTLNLEALGFTPNSETRLHVFEWHAQTDTVSATAGTLPALPTGMTWDLSELSTSGDAVIRVCGDGHRAVTEECDDGNTVSGDGCDSTCHVEPPPPPDGGVDAGPDAGADAGDAGPIADAGPDATSDGGYGGKDGGGGLIDYDESNPVGFDIEGGGCSFGGGASTSLAPLAALAALAGAWRRRRRAT